MDEREGPWDPPDIESNNLALQAPTRSDSFEFWRSSHRLLRRCPRVSRHLHSLRDPKDDMVSSTGCFLRPVLTNAFCIQWFSFHLDAAVVQVSKPVRNSRH
ncbi:unnamed protein product [Polarella glacialis]|uniref:Uncharacterized protein n=1 Tax=Polarella glacialis TaxID=89957 RepID=A0A813EYE7_POLGL|nr:unnamed protein product [Polarella glacialis]